MAFVLIVLTLAFYWYFFVVPYGFFNEKINQGILTREKISIDLILINYLKTPVTIENQEIMMSDLIRLYTIDKTKYQDKLMGESKKIFDNIFGGYSIYQLKLNNNIILEKKYKGNEPKLVVTRLNSMNIIPFEGNLLELNLFVDFGVPE